MQFDERVLSRTEKRVFALRTLFRGYGYRPYRMRKFEEYDLYSRNKDFLLSDRVITFTDTNGRLKALKPDVTLSIVRNLDDRPDELQRLYYDENVYRVSEHTGTFKEIMQMGLECIGSAGNPSVTEVVDLAEKSLALLAEDHDYVLKVSDLDILTLLTDSMTDSRQVRAEIMRLSGDKNLHGIRELCQTNSISEDLTDRLIRLLGLYGTPQEVLPELEEILKGTEAEPEVGEFREVLLALYTGASGSGSADGSAGSDVVCSEARHAAACSDAANSDERRIIVDFSITGDTNYYNGVALAGYIEGIPECVLVGGRYDKLMQRMKKKSRAIGFAIYLDTMAMLGRIK